MITLRRQSIGLAVLILLAVGFGLGSWTVTALGQGKAAKVEAPVVPAAFAEASVPAVPSAPAVPLTMPEMRPPMKCGVGVVPEYVPNADAWSASMMPSCSLVSVALWLHQARRMRMFEPPEARVESVWMMTISLDAMIVWFCIVTL